MSLTPTNDSMAHLTIADLARIRLLEAIGDPVRLRILFLLGCAEKRNVNDITAALYAVSVKISRPAVSHHLKVLRDAEIVTCEKQGQEMYYRLLREPIVRGLRELAQAVETCYPEPEQK